MFRLVQPHEDHLVSWVPCSHPAHSYRHYRKAERTIRVDSGPHWILLVSFLRTYFRQAIYVHKRHRFRVTCCL